MKKIVSIILVFFAASLLFASGSSGEEARPLSGRTEGTLYSYGEDDTPEVFFFPKEKARWDGTKVTMREWYMLAELQKEAFVAEYLGELKKQYKTAVEVAGLDYLRALDLFSFYSNEKTLNEPSTKFIDKLLGGQGKLNPEKKD